MKAYARVLAILFLSLSPAFASARAVPPYVATMLFGFGDASFPQVALVVDEAACKQYFRSLRGDASALPSLKANYRDTYSIGCYLIRSTPAEVTLLIGEITRNIRGEGLRLTQVWVTDDWAVQRWAEEDDRYKGRYVVYSLKHKKGLLVYTELWLP